MGEIISIHRKREQILRDFLHSEFDDYSSFEWKIEDQTEDYYGTDSEKSMFEVEYKNSTDNEYSLSFRFEEGEKMEIEVGEDCWYEVDDHSWSVKYFWMQIKWD